MSALKLEVYCFTALEARCLQRWLAGLVHQNTKGTISCMSPGHLLPVSFYIQVYL